MYRDDSDLELLQSNDLCPSPVEIGYIFFKIQKSVKNYAFWTFFSILEKKTKLSFMCDSVTQIWYERWNLMGNGCIL